MLDVINAMFYGIIRFL